MDKLTEMKTFLAVALEGSFSAAARRYELSPSAVSKMMARLETRLGARLFDRGARTVRLTQEGQAFREASQHAVDAVDHAEDAVRGRKEQVAGMLTVQAPFTTLKYLVAPAIPAFLHSHPALHMHFVVGSEKPDLLRQGIDIAIHSEPLDDTSLVQKPLTLRGWALVASPDYIVRRGRPRTPDDLAQHDLLSFSVRSAWNHWRFRRGEETSSLRVQGRLRANQAEMLRVLALQGAGIARLADFNVRADLASGRLVCLLDDWMDKRGEMLWLFHAGGRPESARVRAFTDFMAAHLGRPQD